MSNPRRAQSITIDPALLNAYKLAQHRPGSRRPFDRRVRREGPPARGVLRRRRRRALEDHRRRQQLGAGHRRPDHQLLGRRRRGLRIESRRRLHRHGRVVHPRQHHAGRRRLQVDRRRQDLDERRLPRTSTPSRRSASTPPTPTSSSWRASASTAGRATSAACSRAPTAARPGRRCCSATTRPARSTSRSTASNPNVMFAAHVGGVSRRIPDVERRPRAAASSSPPTAARRGPRSRATKGMPAGMVGRIGVALTGGGLEPRLRARRERERRPVRVGRCGRDWTLVNAARSVRQRAFYYTHVFGRSQQQGHRLHAEHQRVPLDRRRQDARQHRPGHARRSPRPLDRSRRLRARDARQRRRRRDHLSTCRRARPNWSDQDFPTAQFYHVTTTAHLPFHVCGAQQDNSTLCVPSNTQRWAAAVVAAAASRRSSRIRPAAASPATSRPIATDPDVFFAGANNGSFLTRLNRRTGEFKEVGAYPRFFSGENVEGRQGTLAVDLPDHLLLRRSERALHELAARLEVAPTAATPGRRSAATSRVTTRRRWGFGRPDHARHEQPGDLRHGVLARARQEGHQRHLGRIRRRPRPGDARRRQDLDERHAAATCRTSAASARSTARRSTTARPTSR